MLKRFGLMLALIAATAVTTAFAQAPTNLPLPVTRTRINFVPGTSAYTLTEELTQGVSQGYVLRLAAQQVLYMTQNGNASIQVLDPRDNVLVGTTTQAGPWGVGIPQTGDYTVVIYGQGSVTLTFYVPPLGLSSQPPVPLPLYRQPIRFAPGSTGYSFTTDLAQGLPVGFVLGISAQQQLYVWTQGNVTVAVLDPQDDALLPVMPMPAQWQFAIPRTGDYTLVLLGAGRAFISINIPPVAGPTSPPPTRITFQPGGTSATMQGTLVPNGIDRYVLRALAGQMMVIDFAPSQQNVTLSISGADGTVLASGAARIDTWRGQLPSTQDYNIAVLSNAAVVATYRLQVTIPPLGLTVLPYEPRRISFTPGGTMATMQGTTATLGLDRFVIRALGGQTMSVSIAATQGPAILIIYGADGNVLISDHAGASSWSGMLPTTQDYFIDTRSVENAAVNFVLQVTIPPVRTSALLTPNRKSSTC
jgi:hypothetical protein